MKLFFTFTLLVVSTTLTSSETVGICGDEKSNEFDECFARALMVSRNQTFPQNLNEVDTLCE